MSVVFVQGICKSGNLCTCSACEPLQSSQLKLQIMLPLLQIVVQLVVVAVVVVALVVAVAAPDNGTQCLFTCFNIFAIVITVAAVAVSAVAAVAAVAVHFTLLSIDVGVAVAFPVLHATC